MKWTADAASLWANRELIRQFSRRQLEEQYRGSYLGFAWSILIPLAMLGVYTFVFSTVFSARWPEAVSSGRYDYALFLFAGLIPYNFFSDVVIRASSLITGRSNFVRRVIFPLEVLPVSLVAAALVNALISLAILLAGILVVHQRLPVSALLLPAALLPVILFAMGLGWFLASLGVFLRDLDHFLRIFLQILFFISPILYPISAIPESLRPFIMLNPLTYLVIPFQETLLVGRAPDWSVYGLSLLGSGIVAVLGLRFFMRSKKTFADVV